MAGPVDMHDQPDGPHVVTLVTDGPPIAPRLVPSPPLLPWRSTATPLRVEVVSDGPAPADVVVQVFNDPGTSPGGDPLEIFPGAIGSSSYVVTTDRFTAQVEVIATGERGDTIQCRIYSGTDLVAIATAQGAADCIAAPPTD
ncbi:MAG: hypothetical protein ABIS35_06585 [Terracoccus sp.]